jgi:hypothetical protein
MNAPKWVPDDFVDETVSAFMDQPNDWLRIVPGGHALLDEHGEEYEDEPPEDAERARLADGQLVKMVRCDNLGDATVTILEDDPHGEGETFKVSRPMPAFATDVWIVGEEGTYSSIAEMVDMIEPEDGEFTVRYLRWTTHRFRYRAETGTLEPEDPASLAPLPEEAEAPLPLFGGAQP